MKQCRRKKNDHNFCYCFIEYVASEYKKMFKISLHSLGNF